MFKLFATIKKELTILFRDKAGLLLLFLMPSVLVVVICLVQENVLKTLGETTFSVILINEDGQQIEEEIKKGLESSISIIVATGSKGSDLDTAGGLDAVNKGKYQALILIPKDFSRRLRDKRAAFLTSRDVTAAQNSDSSAPEPTIFVYFDPVVRGNFRSSLLQGLRQIVLSYEMKEKSILIAEIVSRRLKKFLPDFYPTESISSEIAEEIAAIGETPLIQIKEEASMGANGAILPTSTQHNVPAWALFGMFFVVVPMASTLINERRQSTLSRLLTMPVSPVTILAGKVLAYFLICIAQFSLILFIGMYVLPYLGAPELVIGKHIAPLVLLICSSALAATGYGVMLGTLSGTYEQASMFGSISIVIAAALGGVMVPAYAMPEFMQKVSIFSPLAWGLNGFLDLFVRNGNLSDVLPNIGLMLTFFAATIMTSWSYFFYRSRSGG